jgi:hypothetical protein
MATTVPFSRQQDVLSLLRLEGELPGLECIVQQLSRVNSDLQMMSDWSRVGCAWDVPLDSDAKGMSLMLEAQYPRVTANRTPQRCYRNFVSRELSQL